MMTPSKDHRANAAANAPRATTPSTMEEKEDPTSSPLSDGPPGLAPSRSRSRSAAQALPAPPMSYAAAARSFQGDLDSSSSDEDIPQASRCKTLRPTKEEVLKMLFLREDPNMTPEKWTEIVEAHQKVKMPTQPAGFLYFTIPNYVKKVSCNRYMEHYHNLLVKDQQAPEIYQHRDAIQLFQFGKVDSVRVVKVFLTTITAINALEGAFLNLGTFGNVELLRPISDPFAAYVYMDVPSLPPNELKAVVASFTSLGAAPFYWTARTGIHATTLLDTTIRFFWHCDTLPPSLMVAGKPPQQISFAGKVHIVYLKDEPAPILADRRKAGSHCLRLPNQVVRPAPPTETVSAKRRKDNRPPTWLVDNPQPKSPKSRANSVIPDWMESKTTSIVPDWLDSQGIESVSAPDTAISLPQHDIHTTPPSRPTIQKPVTIDLSGIDSESDHEDGVYSDEEDKGEPATADFLSNLWTPAPSCKNTGKRTRSPGPVPHHQRFPARLFKITNSTYRTHGFLYTDTNAQHITVGKGSKWPAVIAGASIRRLRSINGRLALSKEELTMKSLDEYLSKQDNLLKDIPHQIVRMETMYTLDKIAKVEDAMELALLNYAPHTLVKIAKDSFVGTQVVMERWSSNPNRLTAHSMAEQLLFQRIMASSSKVTQFFNKTFQELTKMDPHQINFAKVQDTIMTDPIMAGRSVVPHLGNNYSQGELELAMAWFELAFLARAPQLYLHDGVAALLCGGYTINYLPSHNALIWPTWALYQVLVGPVGSLIVDNLMRTAPDFPLNILLHTTQSDPQWEYPSCKILVALPCPHEGLVLEWQSIEDYPTSTSKSPHHGT